MKRVIENLAFAGACVYLYDLGSFLVLNWAAIVAYYR